MSDCGLRRRWKMEMANDLWVFGSDKGFPGEKFNCTDKLVCQLWS